MKQILISPVITEKSMSQAAESRYIFEVDKRANKPEIARAVQTIYKVKVASVNVLKVRGKSRRFRGKISGKTKEWKKAVVKLAKGQKIAEFDVKEGK